MTTPNKQKKEITINIGDEFLPDFLRLRDFHFQEENDERRIFVKAVQKLAAVNTPMGTMYLPVGQGFELLVAQNKSDSSYRLGIIHEQNKECSDELTAQTLEEKLVIFEQKLANQ